MGRDNSRLIAIIGAFVLGLLIGWFILGWLLFPVTYSDARLADVRAEDKQLYLQTVAQAYQADPNQAQTVQRLKALGAQQDVEALAAEIAQRAMENGDVTTANQIYAMASGLGLAVAAPAGATGEPPTATEQPASETSGSSGGGLLRALLGLLVLGGGIVLAVWLLRQGRRKPESEPSAAAEEPAASSMAYQPPPTEPPATRGAVSPTAASGSLVREYTATFVPGDATYDETFSIEAPGGGYLGECGMTFSEMINGDPARTTAMEVWLFDKSDIRTVTKVLMSDYAFGNPALREKLGSRGDAVLARPGEMFVLDAQTLRLEAQIKELEYAEGDAPPRAAFRRLAVSMKVSRQVA